MLSFRRCVCRVNCYVWDLFYYLPSQTYSFSQSGGLGLIGYILIFHECRIIQRNHFSLHQKYLCCLEYFQQGNGLLGMPFGGFLLNCWTPNVMLKIFSILKNLQILGLSFFNMFTVLLAFDGKNYLFIYSPVPNNRGGPTDRSGNRLPLIMGIALAESRNARGASHQPASMGDCLSLSRTCFYVFASFAFLMFSVFNKFNKRAETIIWNWRVIFLHLVAETYISYAY